RRTAVGAGLHVEQRPERADDEREALVDRWVAEVAVAEVDLGAGGRRPLARDLEHPARGVDADDPHARQRDGDRDPAGPDAELEHRPAGAPRLLDVEVDVLDDAHRPGVVEPCDPIVGRHAGMLPPRDGLAGIRGGRGGRVRRGGVDRRARGGARALPRPQERARARPPRRARPRERDAPERDPAAARGVGGGAGAAPRRRGARPPPARGGDRRHPPGRGAAGRPPAPGHADPPGRRGRVPRPRLRGARRPRGRDGRVQLRQARVPADALGALPARHVLLRLRPRAADGDEPVADPLPRGAAAADLHGLDRARLPPRRDHRDALPDLPPVRGARRRQGADARRPEGDAAARDARALRAGPAGALPDALLPVHRAVDRARRVVRDLRRRRLPHLQVLGLDRDGRRGHGRPARVRARRPRPGGVGRLRVRLRARARRAAPPRRPRHPRALGGRPPRAEAVLTMRVPVSWLAEYVPLEMPLEELATRLSVASAEVEGIERRGVADTDGNLGLFRVGRVVEAAKHPNADRLRLTKVDVGEGEPRSIVCGAWNFGVGATVGVALPGALLPPRPDFPEGLRLERRTVRGEVSDGMILAEDEVGLGSDHSGIMVLPEAEPGTPLADVLPLADAVLLVEATGNRPDLQSVYGIAREVAALYDLPLAELPAGRVPAATGEVRIDVEDFGGCPRYIGRVFDGVSVAPSPVWLRSRLFAAGMRPISNVVDVTNYVMLALGSPLHAFDLATLHEGRVVVRRAGPRETLRTLDGVERALSEDDLLIADADRGIALAGIMGGEETEIGGETRAVLLEAANFDPFRIYLTSERHRLRTESSGRWEKGVDPYLAEAAADLATSLILELAGGELTAAADVHAGLPERPVVPYRPERADALVGVATPPGEQYALLARLGFEREGGSV